MRKSESPVRVGIVGLGYWGQRLLTEYVNLSRATRLVEIVKICDKDRGILSSSAKKSGIEAVKLTMDAEEVMKSEQINAVHIATPNPTHYQLCLQALGRNKHVLVEKPMALSSLEAFRLTRMAEEKSLVLQVGHIFLLNKALKKAKEMIKKDFVGKVHFLDLTWATHMRPFADRGIIFDLAPHPIDILNYLLEEWPTSAYTTGASYASGDAKYEDTAFSILEFPQNVLAKITLTWIQHGPKTRSVTVVGSKNTLVIDALSQTIRSYGSNEAGKDLRLRPNNTIQDMILHYVACIEGKGAPANSALVGALVVRTLEAMSEGLKRKIRVPVLPEIVT